MSIIRSKSEMSSFINVNMNCAQYKWFKVPIMTSISFTLINRVEYQLCQSQKWQYHLCGDELCARRVLVPIRDWTLKFLDTSAKILGNPTKVLVSFSIIPKFTTIFSFGHKPKNLVSVVDYNKWGKSVLTYNHQFCQAPHFVHFTWSLSIIEL